MGTREKAGKIYLDMRSKVQDIASPFEVVSEIGNDFMPKLMAMVERDKRKSAGRDFFIEVCAFMNPLMLDVPEYRMISRWTCPTPFYDRGAFHFIAKDDRLEFLWFVPSPKECAYYLDNMLNLTDGEREAAKTVLDFKDGTLLRIAKKLNGETENDELIFYRKDEDGRPITS